MRAAYEDAIGVYDRVEAITVIRKRYRYRSRNYWSIMGRLEEAVAEGERLVELFPDEPMFTEMLSDLYMQTGRMG
jgi:tetratricopeptide (TPR) repeat protein